MIYSRFDSALAVRVYPGEPLTLELQLTDDSGSVEQVGGRVFDLVLCDITGTAIPGAIAVGVATADESGPYVTATLDGDQTAVLAVVVEPSYFFREIVANGADPIIRGKVEVYPAPVVGSPGPTPPALGTSGRFVRRVSRAAIRVTVVQRGARGFTPEERLAFTRDPATGTPYIAEPTVAAMAEWLGGIAGDGAEALEIAQQALDLATAGDPFARDAAAAASDLANEAQTAADQALDAAELATLTARTLVSILPNTTATASAFTTELNALAQTATNIGLAPGETYYVRSPLTGTGIASAPIIKTVLKPVTKLHGNGARIVHLWDPATPESLGGLVEARGGDELAVDHLTYEHSPRLTTQGVVTSVVGASFYLAVQPGHEPAWSTGDNILRIVVDPSGEWGVSDFKYKIAGASRPFPIEPYLVGGIQQIDPVTGWTLYRASPQDFALNPQEVLSYNPLVFRIRPQDWAEGGKGVGAAFAGAWAALLNGNTYTFVPVNPDADNVTQVYVYDASGQMVDATSATGVAIGSAPAFLTAAVPAWVQAGATIVIQCRKRMANVFYARGVERVRFDSVTIRSCGGVAFFIWDFDRLYLDATLRGDGYVTCNGGPANGFNGRQIEGPGLRSYGSGDDVFNYRGRALHSAIQAYDVAAGWFDMIAFAFGTAHTKTPTAPKSGDTIEFTPASITGEETRTVRSVGASPVDPTLTRVTFREGSLPAAFTPATMRVLNRTRVPVIRMDELFVMASAARGLVPQSHDCRIKRYTCIGSSFSAIRALGANSRGGQFGDGGYKGGLDIDTLEVRRSVLRPADDDDGIRAVIRIDARRLDQLPLAGPTGWKPNRIGEIIADSYSYALLYNDGVDTQIGAISIRDGGTLRPVPLPTDPNNFDVTAFRSTVTMGANLLPGHAVSYQEAEGGFVSFPSGSGADTGNGLPVAAVAGQTTIVMPKKVKAGDEGKVRVEINGQRLPRGRITANGSATITIAPVPALSAADQIYASCDGC